MFSSIIKDHKSLGAQVFQLAWSDIRRQYRGAALGWYWAIIKPAIMIAVYWFVLGKGLRAESSIDGSTYFQWLLVGILPWFFIRDMMNSGTNSLKKYSYLITKIKFPTSAIPTFVGIANLIVNLFLLMLVVGILLLTGNEFSSSVLQLPLYILLMWLLMVGWSLLASPIAAISKDFSNLMSSVTQVLFWISGIIYNIDVINNETARAILRLNPINFIIEGFRKSLLGGEWFYEDSDSLLSFSLILIALILTATISYSRTRSDVADAL